MKKIEWAHLEETMSVHFDEIVFQNDNGAEISLTIEAPAGNAVVREHPVPANSTYRVRPGVDNCATALCEAAAASHSVDRQTFQLAASPQQAYLTHVSARYVIGSIHGSVAGRTENGG
jgi:hypothetical protein